MSNLVSLTILFYTLTVACNSDQKNSNQLLIKKNLISDSLLTKIFVENSDRDFSVKKGNVISDSIKVKNIGKKSLLIESVKSTCDCTTIGYNNGIPLKSSDSTWIKYQLNTDQMEYGYNFRTINIKGNFFPYFKNVVIVVYCEK